VDAGAIRFAHRRFGKPGGVPIVFNMHYFGGILATRSLPSKAPC
jgi:hypothetical protein